MDISTANVRCILLIFLLHIKKTIRAQIKLTPPNIDTATVEGFGKEWSRFTQHDRQIKNGQRCSQNTFHSSTGPENLREPWTWDAAVDDGCTGGTAMGELVARMQARSPERRQTKCARIQRVVRECSPETLPFPGRHLISSFFSRSVLHPLAGYAAAIRSLSSKLAAGGTLLVYLYYALDNRPDWFRKIWEISDLFRRESAACLFPCGTQFLRRSRLFIYWPLARTARYSSCPIRGRLSSTLTASFM